MRLRILILAVLCSLVAVAAPTAASAKLTVGVSENNPALFGDPLFKAIRAKHTRLVVSWNAVAAAAKGDNEISDKIAPYLANAAQQKVDVLISFEHARGDTHGCSKTPKLARCKLPSVSAYKSQVTAFLKLFPSVKTISPWNEANAGTQPTRHSPKRAGQYAKAVDQICKSLKRKCSNVVMDILDTADNTNAKRLKYTRTGKFIKGVRKGYGKRPSICGIHNYADVNRFRTNGTKALTKAMKCKRYWLTETGGIYKFGPFWTKALKKQFKCKTNTKCQAKATTYLFKKTVKAAKHIDRAYIFNFYRGTDGIHDYGITTGDGQSGSAGRFGKARPAYSIVKKHV